MVDVTYKIYSTHIFFGIYGGLKSFQTVTSFKSGRSLSLTYFLDFCFVSHIKNHTYMILSDILNSKLIKVQSIFKMAMYAKILFSKMNKNEPCPLYIILDL